MYPFFAGLVDQLRIFGTRIEDDALRVQAQNIVVPLGLVMGADIEGNCIDIGEFRLIAQVVYLLTRYLSCFDALQQYIYI